MYFSPGGRKTTKNGKIVLGIKLEVRTIATKHQFTIILIEILAPLAGNGTAPLLMVTLLMATEVIFPLIRPGPWMSTRQAILWKLCPVLKLLRADGTYGLMANLLQLG